MIYIVKINNKEYEVEVQRGKANITKTITVAEPSTPVPVPVPAAAPVSAPAAPAPAVPAEGELVRAPMPGTIIDIKVSAGASVKKGETILILEAMKMENEVVASANGVVAQVYVTKGSSVATDDVLISIQ